MARLVLPRRARANAKLVEETECGGRLVRRTRSYRAGYALPPNLTRGPGVEDDRYGAPGLTAPGVHFNFNFNFNFKSKLK